MSNIWCREFLENDNITFNDNGTLTYIPRRKIVYVPEMSVNNPAKDMLNVPNIPLLVSVVKIGFIASILNNSNNKTS